MTAQWQYHRCEGARKSGATIETVRLDHKMAEWEWVHRHVHSETGWRVEVRDFVTFCPYCGERLDG